MNSKKDTRFEVATFDQYGEFEVGLYDLTNGLMDLASGGAVPALIADLSCPNVVCSPTDVFCGITNLCIKDYLCIPNKVC